jgi:hypothetical protein
MDMPKKNRLPQPAPRLRHRSTPPLLPQKPRRKDLAFHRSRLPMSSPKDEAPKWKAILGCHQRPITRIKGFPRNCTIKMCKRDATPSSDASKKVSDSRNRRHRLSGIEPGQGFHPTAHPLPPTPTSPPTTTTKEPNCHRDTTICRRQPRTMPSIHLQLQPKQGCGLPPPPAHTRPHAPRRQPTR